MYNELVEGLVEATDMQPYQALVMVMKDVTKYRRGGKWYDPARRALNGTWAPPKIEGERKGSIIIKGECYGFQL